VRKLAENSDLTHKKMPYSIQPTEDQYVIVNDETGERLYTHESYEDALEQVQALYANEDEKVIVEKLYMMNVGDLVSYNSETMMFGYVEEVMTSGEMMGLLATEADPILKISPAVYDEEAMGFVAKENLQAESDYAYHYASAVSPYKLELPEDAPVFDWEMEGTDPTLPATVADEELVAEEPLEDDLDSDQEEDVSEGMYDDLNLYELTQEELVRLVEMMGHPEEELRGMLEGRMSKDAIGDRYTAFHNSVNMSASEITRWGESECSNLASRPEDGGQGGANVRDRVVKLLNTPRADWGQTEFRMAGRVVNFISRMRGNEQGEPAREGCPSKRDISLMNWGYNPNKKSYSIISTKMRDVEMVSQDEEGAIFEGYGNVFDIRDLGGDIVKKGAFRQTLLHKKGKVFLQADHKYNITDFLGVAYMEEDDKGLKTKMIVNTKTRIGQETADNIKFCLEHNLPIGLSIGYDVVQEHFDSQTKSRIITEVKLYELSVTLFPMNQASLIESAKDIIGRMNTEERKQLYNHLQGASALGSPKPNTTHV
jgi:HK97 family phage prohead protease